MSSNSRPTAASSYTISFSDLRIRIATLEFTVHLEATAAGDSEVQR